MHGHVLSLLDEKLDYLFLPSVISMARPRTRVSQSYCCPLVQAIPYMLRSALDLDRAPVKLLEPPLMYLRGRKSIERSLVRMGRGMGLPAAAVRRALAAAEEAQGRFSEALRAVAKEALEALGPNGRAMVVMGRPYNTNDAGVNLNLPRKLRALGVVPLPQDFLDAEAVDLYDQFPNMYWRYGQRLPAAAQLVRNDPRLFAVYLSNFKCGPDSFIEHFFRSKLEGKPYLQLEIDEHSADARGSSPAARAFVDSLANFREAPPVSGLEVSPGGPEGAPDALRAADVAARARVQRGGARLRLPVGAAPRVGRAHDGDRAAVRLGAGVPPFITTTGDMLKKLFEPGFDHRTAAFFMPTATGPCRFRAVRPDAPDDPRRPRLKDVPIVAPSRATRTPRRSASRGTSSGAWRGAAFSRWISSRSFCASTAPTRPSPARRTGPSRSRSAWW